MQIAMQNSITRRTSCVIVSSNSIFYTIAERLCSGLSMYAVIINEAAVKYDPALFISEITECDRERHQRPVLYGKTLMSVVLFSTAARIPGINR